MEENLYRRITPACAGNSQTVEDMIGALEDHPRVCGEQRTVFLIVQRNKGSPPRVRGTGSKAGCDYLHDRITPACAGNSCSSARSTAALMDHPRVCGEQGKTC